jgi:hypothetical protein
MRRLTMLCLMTIIAGTWEGCGGFGAAKERTQREQTYHREQTYLLRQARNQAIRPT